MIIMGADRIACVSVMCPKVASIATKPREMISFIEGWTQTDKAGGARVSVTNTLSMQTITKELWFFVNSFDNRYEIANSGAEITWANWPSDISWKPGRNMISVPIKAIIIANILLRASYSPKNIAAPILIYIGPV